MTKLPELLKRIRLTTSLAIPKSIHSIDHIRRLVGDDFFETPKSWKLPCTHSIETPAEEAEILSTENSLGFRIPNEYREFLKIANGAKLFVVHNEGLQMSFPGATHTRYQLYGCRELVDINKRLLDTFLKAYADDLEYGQTRCLNYMAFCDAADGNYQSILRDEVNYQPVFFLFHELLYRPYSELDSDFNYTIAPSLESWFRLMLESDGWDGRGPQAGGL